MQLVTTVPQPPPLPTAPAPSDPEDIDRWQHSALRRRLLYGRWREDARARVQEELRSIERADAWGRPDMTGNLFTPLCARQSALYTPHTPRVSSPTGDDDPVLEALAAGGLWELMVRGQRDTIGMREWLVRIDRVADPTRPLKWGLRFRPVYTDLVVIPRAHARHDDLPGEIRELYQDEDERGQKVWRWDCWRALGDGSEPVHEYRDAGGRVLDTMPREAGSSYPHWSADGEPVVPYSLYHAQRTGCLWDPYEQFEIVEGSFSLCVLWTFFRHAIRGASWAQRWIANAILGSSVKSPDQGGTQGDRQRAVMDPATIAILRSLEDGVPVQAGQWATTVDPSALATAISFYERRIVALAGVNPADVQRVTGDPRSGYALEISMTAQEEARATFTPSFRRGDLETIRVAAAVLGSAAGIPLPGAGYGIEYGPEEEPEPSPPAPPAPSPPAPPAPPQPPGGPDGG